MKQLLKPKMLVFTADWCGPSQAWKRLLESFLENIFSDKFLVEHYNTDTCSPDLLNRWKVLGIPTTIITKNDKEVLRIVGYNSKESTHQFLNKGLMLAL